jgi:hypothetical protein
VKLPQSTIVQRGLGQVIVGENPVYDHARRIK